ncbi:cyclin-dependent kinase inhibitor 7-like [Ananas comosus]|uniref:Cyclin-dependent kinase inhibitor 7-like n=1 Tax=Ananas comosus TaxID=4615 RepID=A0A6P5FN83_ANACO|nr:cyclin-dependent kinase inhibitor 7-like [Ananas comosus]
MAMAAAAAAAGEGERVKRRRTAAAAVAAAEIPVTYIQLRSRSVMMKPRPARSAANPGARRASAELARIPRCSSNASCEAAPEDAASRSSGPELDEEPNSVAFSHDEGIRDSDLESTAGRESKRRSTALTPSEAEIEHFFAAHERAERKRFATKYNYNIITDAPLKGRYEWVRLKP